MGVGEGADALVLYKGMLGLLERVSDKLPGIFMHLSASSELGCSLHHKVLIGTVEEALRRGADGVSIHVNLGTPDEPEMLRDLGRVGEACAQWQVPLLVMMYVRGSSGAAAAPDTAVAHAARMAAELGADIIKIPIPEDFRTLEEIAAGLPVPVVVAGGSRIIEAKVFLERVERAMEAGAQGVAIGRNIFQSQRPELLLRALCKIVHRGLSAGRAWEEAKGAGLAEPLPAG